MSMHWEKLIRILSGMVTLYGGLLKLGQEKRQALIAADMEKIEQFTAQEEALVLKSAQLENMRQAALEELAAALGCDVGELVLSELKKNVPQEMREQLEKNGDELKRIAADLAVLTQSNSELIENALRIVNFNIQLLTQDAAVPSYGGSGAEGDGAMKNRAIFDRKV